MTVRIDSRNVKRVPAKARDSDEPMKTFYDMRSNAFNMSDGSKIGWLVDFGFYGPLRQYFGLYRAVSQREGERGKKG